METTSRTPMTRVPRLAIIASAIAMLVALDAGAVSATSPSVPPSPTTQATAVAPTGSTTPSPIETATAGIPPTSCGPVSSLASGTIATIAGTGVAGSTGDGGPALDAQINPGRELRSVRTAPSTSATPEERSGGSRPTARSRSTPVVFRTRGAWASMPQATSMSSAQPVVAPVPSRLQVGS